MKVDIVRIGNSRGVRIPKKVLDELGFGESAELDVRDGVVTLRPAASVRDGWEAAFADDPPSQADELWTDELSSEADKQWTW